MAKIIPAKINNTLGKVDSKGKTLVFDISVTMANIHGRRLHAIQSTSSLIPHEDLSVELTREVTPENFWVVSPLEVKHFLMIQAPHAFYVDLADPNLNNSITVEAKRLYFFAGKFDGRLSVRSDIDQQITVSYA